MRKHFFDATATQGGVHVTRRGRVSSHAALVALVLLFLSAAPAFPAGFSIFAQGAKASGMGLAFTAVADDPSAIFYNPAGLGWQKHFSSYAGGSLLTKVEGDFEGANPFPGDGLRSRGSAQDELPPPDVLRRRSPHFQRQLRTRRLRALRPGLPVGRRRAVLGPLHRAERRDPVVRRQPGHLLAGLPDARDRGRRRLPALESARSSATARRSTPSPSPSWTSRTSS